MRTTRCESRWFRIRVNGTVRVVTNAAAMWTNANTCCAPIHMCVVCMCGYGVGVYMLCVLCDINVSAWHRASKIGWALVAPCVSRACVFLGELCILLLFIRFEVETTYTQRRTLGTNRCARSRLIALTSARFRICVMDEHSHDHFCLLQALFKKKSAHQIHQMNFHAGNRRLKCINASIASALLISWRNRLCTIFFFFL